MVNLKGNADEGPQRVRYYHSSAIFKRTHVHKHDMKIKNIWISTNVARRDDESY